MTLFKSQVHIVRLGVVLLIAAMALVLWGDSAEAQRRRWRRSWDRMERDIFPSNSFTFCRIEYSSESRGWGRRGGSWATDYPEADENFSLRLSQITTLNVNRTGDGRFQHVVVRLDEPELMKYPFAYMLEVGRMALSAPERGRVAQLFVARWVFVGGRFLGR